MITIIAAIAYNNALGKDNKLIWHLPSDLKRFKNVTLSHSIIMGRKTFESLKKALPNRKNIVITRNPDYKAKGCAVVNSLQAALELVKDEENSFIMGGAQIYTQALKIADKLDLTFVHHKFEADTFFPEIDATIWKETSRMDCLADDKNKYDYSFVSFERH